MPLISDPSNTRSNFPFTLDSLTLYSNGTGVTSTVDAEAWNILESVIYRLEKHVQATPLFIDSSDRKRVCVSGTVSIAPGTSQSLYVIGNLTAAQLAFLNNNLQSTGSMFFADVVHLTGTDACTTNILPGPTTMNVYIQRVDPSQTLSGGLYLVNLTILGY